MQEEYARLEVAAQGFLGNELFDYQNHFAQWCFAQPEASYARACLYYRTGAGKTETAMLGMHMLGHQGVFGALLIIAPLSTHKAWQEVADKWQFQVDIITHEKFRQKNFRVSRDVPIICDEFHKLGGARGVGWRKFDRVCEGINAPVFILSATPQYNDAERVYCVAHAMDSSRHRGGYLEFLARHCLTKVNPFSQTPDVIGFQKHKDAADFLTSLPYVFHVPDTPDIPIIDETVMTDLPEWFLTYGLHPKGDRIMASDMERRKTEEKLLYLEARGDRVRLLVIDALMHLKPLKDGGPTIIFCASKTIANALAEEFTRMKVPISTITGDTHKDDREIELEHFKQGDTDILIGTSAMATGTDGLDKMCNDMILFHDTDDDTLRKQLIGRIKARGKDSDNTDKKVYRITVVPRAHS